MLNFHILQFEQGLTKKFMNYTRTRKGALSKIRPFCWQTQQHVPWSRTRYKHSICKTQGNRQWICNFCYDCHYGTKISTCWSRSHRM